MKHDIKQTSYMALPGLLPCINRVSFTLYSNVDKVIKVVSEFTGISVDKMMTNAKDRHISDSRFIMWYMIRKFTKMTLVDIGVMFKRDHTSVMYGVQRCSNLITTEKDFRDKIRFIESQLSDN